MNLLDRVINYFAPTRGMVRIRARHATRIYEGASQGRRAAAWRSTGASANSELQIAIAPLRDRARELARNTPHASRMLDIIVAHSVGKGIVPVSSTGMDKIDNKVMSLWEDFCKQADVTGCMTFYAMQVLAVRSMIESGEAVIRFIDTPMSDGVAVPLQLQLLECDFIDHFRDGVYGSEGLGAQHGTGAGVERTRLGVGLGKYDVFKGLWLWPYHPGEMTTTINYKSFVSEFVPRDELIHMFRRERPGQVRGVTWFAPVLTIARDMADFIDAANVKARMEACFAGFIINSDESVPLFDQSLNGTQDVNVPDAMTTTIEPGMLKELRSGQDIKFATPTATSQIETILMYNLQALSVGVGCTYDQTTGDLRQANYSSLRAGKLDFWGLIGQLQAQTIIPQLCQPIWERFISRAILAGRLPDRKKNGGYPCEWVVPAREMIDPKKDFDAQKNLVRSGAMTPQQYIASFGGNWREALADFKSFFEMAHNLNVTLDIDVARVDQHGRQPPAKGAPGDPQSDAQDEVENAKNDGDDDLDQAA